MTNFRRIKLQEEFLMTAYWGSEYILIFPVISMPRCNILITHEILFSVFLMQYERVLSWRNEMKFCNFGFGNFCWKQRKIYKLESCTNIKVTKIHLTLFFEMKLEACIHLVIILLVNVDQELRTYSFQISDMSCLTYSLFIKCE